MRRILTFLAVAFLVVPGSIALTSAPASAQQTVESSSRPRLKLGVVGLLNMSTFAYSADGSVDELNDATEYKLGYGGGLRAIYDFTPNIGIQPEILFKQYGAEFEEDMGIFGSLDGGLTTNYLHIPLLARIALPLAGNALTPKIVAGPTLSYYLSGSGEIEGESGDIDADDVNRFDFGLAAGVGADIDLGPGALSIDARYDRSLTAFNKSRSGDGGLTIHNTGFSLLLGYAHAF